MPWNYKNTVTTKAVGTFLAANGVLTHNWTSEEVAELIGNEHVDIAPRIFGFLTSPTKAPKISSKSAIHTKYVCQYALDGTLINTYDSYEAASNATGFSIKAIQKAVYGERHSTGGFQWRTYRNKNDIKCICCVGFVEETVFRGWGYNALRGIVSEKKAAILSTLFFVLLHSPAYFVRCYRLGAMDYDTWIIQSISATVWGIVFCWLLKKSKTIWNPIIAHVVYDVFVTVFVE